MQETWVWSLGQEDPLEKGMATHSSILAWRIPWIEEPCRLQSMGKKTVGHNWVTSTHFCLLMLFGLSTFTLPVCLCSWKRLAFDSVDGVKKVYPHSCGWASPSPVRARTEQKGGGGTSSVPSHLRCPSSLARILTSEHLVLGPSDSGSCTTSFPGVQAFELTLYCNHWLSQVSNLQTELGS